VYLISFDTFIDSAVDLNSNCFYPFIFVSETGSCNVYFRM
jgi:hypothetical protein